MVFFLAFQLWCFLPVDFSVFVWDFVGKWRSQRILLCWGFHLVFMGLWVVDRGWGQYLFLCTLSCILEVV